MNDFTKEELESIYLSVSDYWYEDPLLDKIRSMIDDYCEHDGEIGKYYPAEKCMKCGAYW
jgi:hypothetical protein